MCIAKIIIKWNSAFASEIIVTNFKRRNGPPKQVSTFLDFDISWKRIWRIQVG
jgi:hypothetical protein